MAMGWLARMTSSLALAAAFVAVDGAAPALAASCSSLKSQLASASSRRANPARAATYQRAAGRQRSELATTRRMAARAGCARRDTPQCGTLNSTIQAMEKRIAELDRQASRAKGSSGASAASLRRQIARQGCDAPRRSAANARKTAPKPKSTASVRPARTSAPTRRVSVATPGTPGAPRGGEWRTVCVRTCDGYFFPVSNAVAPQAFPTDVKRCAAMCPRAETKLFVHGRNGDAQSMFDRTGKRYHAMPYAFGHTKPDYRPSAACTCGRPLAPRAKADLRGSAERAAPAPRGIAPPAGDAETRRNASVGFGWTKAREIVATGSIERPERTVRVVGPTFLPDPAAAAAR